MLAANVQEDDPMIDEQRLKEVLSSNLCRCTAYQNIVKSMQPAAQTMRRAATANIRQNISAPKRQIAGWYDRGQNAEPFALQFNMVDDQTDSVNTSCALLAADPSLVSGLISMRRRFSVSTAPATQQRRHYAAHELVQQDHF
jgi:xanthine dehydrogenase iron-sulfur cluster and FAD-binding subunit A